MGWHARGVGRRRYYFYLTVRVDREVRKLYLGAGEAAKRAAEQVAAAQFKRVADHAELAALQMKLAGVDQVVAEVEHGVGLLTEATLLAQGFREHRGQWRLRRD